MVYAMTKLYAAIYGSAIYEKWLLLCCENLDMHMKYTLLKNYCLCFELPGHGWYFAQSLPTFPSPQVLLFFFSISSLNLQKLCLTGGLGNKFPDL